MTTFLVDLSTLHLLWRAASVRNEIERVIQKLNNKAQERLEKEVVSGQDRLYVKVRTPSRRTGDYKLELTSQPASRSPVATTRQLEHGSPGTRLRNVSMETGDAKESKRDGNSFDPSLAIAPNLPDLQRVDPVQLTSQPSAPIIAYQRADEEATFREIREV